jgi:hypothetical protein
MIARWREGKLHFAAGQTIHRSSLDLSDTEMRAPELSDDQRRLLEVAYRGFREKASWPTSAHVDAILDQEYAVDFQTVLGELPATIVIPIHGYSDQSQVMLTVAGLSFVEAAGPDLANFLALLNAAVERESHSRPGPDEVSDVKLTQEDEDHIWGRKLAHDELARALEITKVEGINAGAGGPNDEGEWHLGFNRWIRPYRGVDGIDDYVARRPEPAAPEWAAPLVATPYIFILMPFRTPWSSAVMGTIDEACREVSRQFAGLSWERADGITETGRITDQIVAAIERADALIADITGTNPNVLFELGYGDALNKSIIVLNQELDRTPFDIKDWRQIEYQLGELPTLCQALSDFLVATLRKQGFQAPALPAES